MTREHTLTPLSAIYRNLPGAYFLSESIMHKASNTNWKDLAESITLTDEDRVDQELRRQIRRADHKRLGMTEGERYFTQRYKNQHRFRPHVYKEIYAQVAPTTFLCRTCGLVVSLERKIQSNKVTAKDLTCPTCNTRLNQVIHVFCHSACGEIKEIVPRNCPDCHQSMRLRIDNLAFGYSEWYCANGHIRPLLYFCPQCSTDQHKQKMIPYTATTLIKPVSITMVDIKTTTSWYDIARTYLNLQGQSLHDVILNSYADPLVRESIEIRLNANRVEHDKVVEAFLLQHPEYRQQQQDVLAALDGEPDESIQRSLAEFHGTQLTAASVHRDPLAPYLRRKILEKFHVSPRYIPNLKILQVVYGYQVGKSDLEQAIVRTFDQGFESIALVHRMATEAALFEVDPSAITAWINRRLGLDLDPATLRKVLLRKESCPQLPGDEIYELAETLLHTISHLLIRQSELFTGLSRDSLSEQIFTPALAFYTLAAEGSELGALRSAFASYRLRDWLEQCLAASRECSHDPICTSGKITGSAACHACLFIAERRCNNLWNESLDRRLVSNVQNKDGFWD
jgi:hypothetical protein